MAVTKDRRGRPCTVGVAWATSTLLTLLEQRIFTRSQRYLPVSPTSRGRAGPSLLAGRILRAGTHLPRATAL